MRWLRSRALPWLPWLGVLVLPALWVAQALRGSPRAFGRGGTDLVAHLWAMWNASQGPATRSALASWPAQVDLLPVLPGWTDVVLGGLLLPWVGLLPAYALVCGLYLAVAGLGGAALARAAGAGPGAALAAGLLLQLDGYVLDHLQEGRPEQVGAGVLALFLAGAWRLCQPGATLRAAAATGLAGALTLATAWELGVVAGLVALWMLPVAVGARLPAAAWRRLGEAALVGLALTGPPVAVFLTRAAAARPADESAFSLPLAAAMSVPALEWFLPGEVRPAWLVLLTLPAAALLGPRAGLRARLWIGLGLLLCLAVATGPAPRWTGPSGAPAPWAPFLLLQRLPLMGWFHWPDRLLLCWSLVGVVAAARVLEAVRQRLPGPAGVATAALLAAALVGDAAVEARQARRWPDARYRLPPAPGLRWLAEHPHPGAVLDLPGGGHGNPAVDYTAAQLIHGRPVRFGLVPERITGVDHAAWGAAVPLIAWSLASQRGPAGPAPPLSDADLRWLSAQGFGWLNLHGRGVDPGVAQALWAAVEARLGRPERDEPPHLRLYRLAPPPE